MQLSEAARRLLEFLDPEGVLIGGICAAIYGVERFTRGVDIAAHLDPETVVHRLREAGIEAVVRRSAEPGDLPWVVHGEAGGIDFQVVPAAEVGLTPGAFAMKAGLRVADRDGFITSKCIAGGQQDLHDVAVLCLLDPKIEPRAREVAAAHGALAKLESWLNDRRLRQRYTPPPGEG